jgi:hypothetical protein
MLRDKLSPEELIEAVREIIFYNCRKKLSTKKILVKLRAYSLREVEAALRAARDRGYVYCTNGLWAPRAAYQKHER